MPCWQPVTPTDLHYVRSNFALPEHDGTLQIDGAVGNPVTLTLDDAAVAARDNADHDDGMRGQRPPRHEAAADRRAMGWLCGLDRRPGPARR